MLAEERIAGTAMIEVLVDDPLKALGRMTGSTVRAELVFVDIAMAGNAVTILQVTVDGK